MPQSDEAFKAKKPLGRSITIGCLCFIIALCLILGLISFVSYRNALYKRYQAYITDILTYIDSHIDDDDLAHCVETKERSSAFDELELFMDAIKEDFDIHYLYILVPLKLEDGGHIMSVISAENYYDRYIDTEGNLYLGWISDDEYDDETVDELMEIMNSENIRFLEEATDWGYDYTGALALRDSSGEPYAILAVDVDITEIRGLIIARTMEMFVVIIIVGVFFTLVFLYWAKRNISDPIMLLEKGTVAYAQKSHGQRDLSELKFEAPDIHTHNEVESLSQAVTRMTEDMQDYVSDIIEAEKKAAYLSALANKDALTGVRNKTAYDEEVERLETDLIITPDMPFGIAMIDLNFLKKINDTCGHDKGNLAIKKLCMLVCTTFTHSPVFRIGGDEFVVILKGGDLEKRDVLLGELEGKLTALAEDPGLELWEKVSAAIGVALYDASVDKCVDDVFRRADEAMYQRKRDMKAQRE